MAKATKRATKKRGQATRKRGQATKKRASATNPPVNATKQRMVVTLSGDRPIHEVAADLRAAGLDVDHVLEAIGSVAGSSPSRNMNRLRGIRGVADVSPEHPPFNIGPPGAPVS
jgi:hypothetical protein